ncbi:MAG: hypothetical protein RLZZ586_1456 [Pseudomonadota bacterium]|jgi:hypothetical protein
MKLLPHNVEVRMKILVGWLIWLVFAERPGEWGRKEWVCRINRQ